MPKSRNKDASTFRTPGASSELGRTVPEEPAGPTPGQLASEVALKTQYAEVSNHFDMEALRDPPVLLSLATLPAAMLGRSLLFPSALRSEPAVMLKGAPLCKVTIAVTVQPFSKPRTMRLAPAK